MGLRPYLKTSGQAGLHVMVGLEPKYTYDQARMFSEAVARLVVNRIPDLATINRNPRTRAGKVYIDYLQLGHGRGSSPHRSRCGRSRMLRSPRRSIGKS